MWGQWGVIYNCWEYLEHPKIAMVFQELKLVTKRSSSSLKASVSLGHSILLRNERLHAAQKVIRDQAEVGMRY